MTHAYTAEIVWTREGQKFTDGRYSRAHRWRFDGGIDLAASSAPSSVPVPFSVAEAVDPEEALVAATSSCHMLFFLFHAAKAGLVVDAYRDTAEATLAKTAEGRWWMPQITLRPAIAFSGARRPTDAELAQLHHRAHDDCYIANSLKSEVVVDPPPPIFA